jgi:hypothetical protein
MCQQERARSTSSLGLTTQQFQHERRKSLFAIRQRYLIDQHILYSSGSLHGGGDATVRALLVASNAASSGCLLLINADTLPSVLRDETCTSKVICRPPANKECSEASTQHSTAQAQAQGPLEARPANDLHGSDTSPPARLHPQATVKPNTSRCVREINKHTPLLVLRPRSPSHPALSRSNGREK